jgi:glycerol-3-phosphate dehydrogenase (NAD(P)+)
VTRAAVLGAGNWGTAFAKVLADAGTEVSLWARRQEIADTIMSTRENPEYLPGVKLPSRLSATADVNQALTPGTDIVVFAVPAQTLRANLEEWFGLIPTNATLVSLAKGVEQGTCKRMTEVICEVAVVRPERVCVLSGPNLAPEIAAEQPTATVIGCLDHERAVLVQKACSAPYFRPYTHTDVVGCELGGAVKNVIALACGIAVGMGFGSNTLASIITRGLAETSRLGMALGAEPLTFAGLAGLGDLVATCNSPLSRNRTFGERLGHGLSVSEVIAETRQTAEGVKSCQAILELAQRHRVDMPITEQVVRVVYEGHSPPDMVKTLMARETKPE